MLLYYAMGGGLGHLTRARAFLHTTGLDGEAVLFTSSSFADDPRVTGGLRVVRVPADLDGDRGGLRALLGRTIAELGVRRLVVDALPAGILGELADFSPPPGLELWHVARLLRWERYAADASARLPRFDRTFVVEELHENHRRALEAASGEMRRLDLVDPPSAAPEPIERPYGLVVHCGPDEETNDLVACARDLQRIGRSEARDRPRLAGETRGHSAETSRGSTPSPRRASSPGQRRIVTAAGFNVVRQTEPFREKRFLVPYPRRFDDQFARAARARIPER